MLVASARQIGLALCLATATPAAAENRVRPSLLDTIELWLGANFGLPPAAEPPDILIVPATRLVEIRYGAGSMVPPGDVVAAYDYERRVIYLTEGWTGRTPGQISVLVHEMVHHLQASADMRFACPAEQELVAYQAQDEWLKLFGTDLARSFGIDPATLLVATVCTH